MSHNFPSSVVPTTALKVLADGLYFGESPRWHQGKLYISDMIGQKIYAIDAHGLKNILMDVPNQPNGMCFLPDGSLIYSSMFDAKLHRYYNGKSELYADLSSLMTGYCGDMVIDAQGRVYIDDTGARVLHGEKPSTGRLLVVDTDRTVRIAAEGLVFPNGVAINGDGTSLIISETFAYCLDKFDIAASTGELTNRRKVWDTKELAKVCGKEAGPMSACDGLCIDAEDGIWMAMLGYERFVRQDKEGRITHQIEVDGHATACALGGEDGKTLFLVTNWVPENSDLFTAMVGKQTRCNISTLAVEVGRGLARP
jgi:sugar lactone lactonase YvrE